MLKMTISVSEIQLFYYIKTKSLKHWCQSISFAKFRAKYSTESRKCSDLVLCDAVDGPAVGIGQHWGNRAFVHVQNLNGAIWTTHQDDV